MENLKAAVDAAYALTAEYEKYEKKPTKAASKRLRGHINDIKRVGTDAKKELLEADKK